MSSVEPKLKWLMVSDDEISTELAPITSLKDFNDNKWQLSEIMLHANPSMGRDATMYFRGCAYKAELGGRLPTSTFSLNKTFAKCRENADMKSPISDADFYLLMRHAGINNTALIDWTYSPENAIWFAIHDIVNDKLRESGEGVLWVWCPTEDDYKIPDGELEPIPKNGVSKSVIYYPYDMHERFERPTQQEAIAVRLKFQDVEYEGKTQPLLPMNKDPQFRGRLLKIPIEGDYTQINNELNAWMKIEKHNPNYSFVDYLGLGGKNDYVIPRSLLEEINRQFQRTDV